eukprot:g9142.t1
MDSISERLKKACEEYIDNYSIRYRCEPSNGSTINMEQQQPHQPSKSFELMQHEFLPLSFYKKDFELHKCFALFERNNKSEEVALSGLRTIGTVVFGHVLKQNERGILIKVLYIRTPQTEKCDEKQPYWDTVADKVDQYETCKVFCKTEDMGNIKNQININNNNEKTLVIAIVKHFNQNANRIEKRNVYSREAIEKAEKSYKHYAKLMEQQAGNVSSSSLKINKKRGHSDMMSKSPAPFDFNGGGGKNNNNKRVKK